MYDDFGSTNVGSLGLGYYDRSGNYKPLKATKNNVLMYLESILGVYLLNVPSNMLERLDEVPQEGQWKHACFLGGVVRLEPMSLIFDDGTPVYFAMCPYCNKVHYIIESSM